jgi:hypothetical protein
MCGHTEEQDVQQYFIVENDSLVDIVCSAEIAEHRSKNGWRVVADCAGDDWRTVVEKAHTRAHEHNKKCHLPPPLSEEEVSRRLRQAYRLIFGDKLWNMLGQLYQVEPDQAVELGMEILKKRLG